MKGIKLRGAPMYLDMQATTPMDPRVVDAMLPYMTEQVGGVQHSGWQLQRWDRDDRLLAGDRTACQLP